MYSRSMSSQRSAASGIRVPKNYSGNAFSFEAPKYEPPVIRESDIIPRKEESTEEKEEIQETKEEVCEEEKNEEAVCKECEVREVCEKEKKKDDLLLGFSFEDLLIVALILILSQNGAEDDILLLLALVLAYKK